MVWDPSVPTVAVAAAGLTTGWLATVGWRRRDRAGGVAFTAMMVGITGWALGDDGEGIPEADRDRVFEAGVSTVEGGTGFGLSIVDTIADAHGWRVSITESTVGNPIPATGGSSGGADRGGDAADEGSETRGGARFEFRNVVCPD